MQFSFFDSIFVQASTDTPIAFHFPVHVSDGLAEFFNDLSMNDFRQLIRGFGLIN